MNHTRTTLFALLFVVLVAPFALAYPTVQIVTEGNTYTGGASSSRVVTPNHPYPYVSGPEYTYWPNTFDYVDGYRDGYGAARVDRYFDNCRHLSGSRYRDCVDRNRYSTVPGRLCDTRRDICYDNYVPCGSGWCRVGSTANTAYYTAWYDVSYVRNPYVVTHYSFSTIPSYGYPVHYPRYW